MIIFKLINIIVIIHISNFVAIKTSNLDTSNNIEPNEPIDDPHGKSNYWFLFIFLFFLVLLRS